MKKNKDRNLTYNEKELWKQVVSDVESYSLVNKSFLVSNVKKLNKSKKTKFIEEGNKNNISMNRFRRIEINEIGDTDRRTFIKLKRGQLNVEAKLDLHGLTLVEAYSALWAFLIRSHKNGLKCVLVITGRGIRNPNGKGKIKNQFPEWLNENSIRPLVIAVSKAQNKDGGDGAFYVLIRKNKKLIL